jgi:dihydrofolate synthase / folylpolyglutamate synthase
VRYRETLDYLYGLQHFGIKLGLANIQQLLERLGHPEASAPVIHVAGTNGKGSVCAGLTQVLAAAGFKVGLYTSPHLHCFTERIRINDRCISEAEVVRLTSALRDTATDIPLTFFEFTTAMALCYFREQQVDFMVMEVGLGGRLDATNVVDPCVTVITPVSEDHSEHLGSDLAAIAGEKAGIIKPHIPLVLGRQERPAFDEIQRQARLANAAVYSADEEFYLIHRAESFDFRGRHLFLDQIQPSLLGTHQRDNLALVLAVAELLRAQGVDLPDLALRRGVETLSWPGRLERWPLNPPVLLDGAHNVAGARVLAEYLEKQGLSGLPWVLGMSGMRRPENICPPWLPHMAHAYVTEPGVGKAVVAADIGDYLTGQGCAVQLCSSPVAALRQALQDWPRAPLVVVAGSLYLVAEVRAWLKEQQP